MKLYLFHKLFRCTLFLCWSLTTDLFVNKDWPQSTRFCRSNLSTKSTVEPAIYSRSKSFRSTAIYWLTNHLITHVTGHLFGLRYLHCATHLCTGLWPSVWHGLGPKRLLRFRRWTHGDLAFGTKDVWSSKWPGLWPKSWLKFGVSTQGDVAFCVTRIWSFEWFQSDGIFVWDSFVFHMFVKSFASGNSKNVNINTWKFWSKNCWPLLITFYYFTKCWRLSWR